MIKKGENLKTKKNMEKTLYFSQKFALFFFLMKANIVKNLGHM